MKRLLATRKQLLTPLADTRPTEPDDPENDVVGQNSRRFTKEQVNQVTRLVREGMSPAWAWAEVLGQVEHRPAGREELAVELRDGGYSPVVYVGDRPGVSVEPSSGVSSWRSKVLAGNDDIGSPLCLMAHYFVILPMVAIYSASRCRVRPLYAGVA